MHRWSQLSSLQWDSHGCCKGDQCWWNKVTHTYPHFQVRLKRRGKKGLGKEHQSKYLMVVSTIWHYFILSTATNFFPLWSRNVSKKLVAFLPWNYWDNKQQIQAQSDRCKIQMAFRSARWRWKFFGTTRSNESDANPPEGDNPWNLLFSSLIRMIN